MIGNNRLWRKLMSNTLFVIGRVILGLFFVVSGFMKAKMALDPQALAGFAGYIGSRGLPQPQIIAYVVTAFEIFAGLAIVFGILTLPVALLLSGFCVATAVMFHNFWTFPPDQMSNQFNSFMKNIGLAGAFLLLASNGLRDRD
jgi:putative oxidoreductase